MNDHRKVRFIPGFIEAQYLRGVRKGGFPGSILISDISGFTGITESLFTLGKRGAEELSTILNGIFSTMIGEVRSCGGFVLCFAGDAFTAAFPGDDGTRAVQAAERIRASLPGSVVSSTGGHELGIGSGVDAGEILWGIYGSGPCAYLFSGRAVCNAATAQSSSVAGEIVRGPGSVPSGRGDLGESLHDPSPEPLPSGVENVFFHRDYLARAESPEFRDVASVFTSFNGIGDMDRFIDTLMGIAEGYGGYFNLLDCGDKGEIVLTLFGAPLTSGRSAQRSIGFAMALGEIYGSSVRSGITYGRVFAGFIGCPGDRGHYTVIGDKVNTAARLMQISSPGEIIISEQTARAIEDSFRIEKMEDRTELPAGCYRVCGRGGRSLQFEFENTFTGRLAELDSFRQLSLSPGPGGTRAVIVTGEAGIGKTRLALQAGKLFPDHRMIYLKCDEILSKSLNPLETFFEETFGTSGLEDSARSGAVFAEKFASLVGSRVHSEGRLGYLAGELSRLEYIIRGFLGIEESLDYLQLDARSRFENTIQAFLHLVRLLAGDSRLFLVIDDYQWMDPDTSSVMGDLLRQLDIDGPVVSVLTRPSPETPPEKMLPEEAVILQMDLGSLAHGEQRALIADSLPCPPSDRLRESIESKAEGNPFYIEQMVMYLLDNRMIECRDGKAVLTSPGLRLPGSIVEIIISRVDALEAEIRKTVKHASVLGRRFNVRVLSRMLSGRTVDEDLRAGAEARIWNRLSELQYIFRHALIRDSVYEMQLEGQLAGLHLMAGQIIEELYSDDERLYSDLSFHFEKAGRRKKMLEYTLKAADHARENYRNREAMEMYRKYLDGETEVREGLKAGMRLAEVTSLVGEWDRALSLYGTIVARAGESGMKELLADATVKMGFLHHRMGDNDDALECFGQAEASYTEMDDSLGLANVYNNIGTVLLDLGRFEETETYLRRSLKISEPLSEDRQYAEIMSFAYNNLGLLYQKMNRLEEASECYGKSMRTAQRINYRRNLAALNFGNIMYLQEKVDEAEKYYRMAMKNAEEIGERHVSRVLLNNLASISVARGDHSGAMAVYMEALELARSMNDRKGMRLLYQNIGETLFFLGDDDASERRFRQARELAEVLGDHRAMGSASGKRGITILLSGDPERALEHLKEGAGLSMNAGDVYYGYEFLFYLARAYYELGRRDELAGVLERMHSVEEKRIPANYRWYAPVAAMLAAAASGSENEMLRRSLEVIRTFGGTEGEALARSILFRLTDDERERARALKVYEELYAANPIAYYSRMIDSHR